MSTRRESSVPPAEQARPAGSETADASYERSPEPARQPPATAAGRVRLLAALALPYVAVALGMWVAQDVYATFALYLGACTLGPWALLGARPFAGRGGLPLLPARGRRGAAVRSGLTMWLLCGPLLAMAYLAARPWLGESARYLARLHALGWRDDAFVPFAVVFVLAIPWIEEWWWRGQALPRCVGAWGARRGLGVAAVAFTGYHAVVLAHLYPPGPMALRLAAILPVAFWWCAVALRHRCWVGPWLAHGPGADLAMALLFAWIHRRG